jgi:S1-C subfamily serine protease
MRLHSAAVLPILCIASYCQNRPRPFTQVEACRTFSDSVVQIKTNQGAGTGFIVGSDGWVITAFHVIADQQSLARSGNPRVIIGNKRPIDAEIVSPIDQKTSLQDFAILKIERSLPPKFDFVSTDEVEVGAPVAIIGFPLSAMFPGYTAGTPIPKFCLTGTIAAQSSFPLGNLRYLHTIYFQGVSVKGISGAPVILLDSGKVVGIVNTKLTGISKALSDLHYSVVNRGLGDHCRRI